MQELYPAKVHILSSGDSVSVTGRNLLFYYVVYGEMIFSAGVSCRLAGEGFIAFNAGDAHRYTLPAGSLAVCVEIYRSAIEELTKNPLLKFDCRSPEGEDEAATLLRYQVKRMLLAHTYPNELNRIRMQRQLYDILLLLVSRYSLSRAAGTQAREAGTDDRDGAIMAYIQSGYTQAISLQELGERLHLSVPYLSKYIKQLLGKGFVTYVNDLRLYHAVDDLHRGAHSLTRIAYDNGFSNLSSFIRVFKDQHGMTPSEYKKQHVSAAAEPGSAEKSSGQIASLKQYFKDFPLRELKDAAQASSCEIDVTRHRPLKCNWRQYCSIGCAEDLLDSGVRDHLLILKRELGIGSMAIWSLFVKEMLIDIHAAQFNFSRIDSVMDFLNDNDITPLIDFASHPKELYSGGEDPIYYEQHDIGFENMDQYARLLGAFLRHCIKRYGVERVERWTFEQGCDVRLQIAGGELSFLSFFRTAYHTVKQLLPNARIGGGAVFLYDNGSGLEQVLEQWSRFPYKPEFLTIWLTPYDLIEDGQYRRMRFSRDESYMSSKLETAKQIMARHGFEGLPLYVGRWNLSLSCRSLINDSCYKGAYMIKTLIECMDDVDVMAYYGSTDLQFEHYDSYRTISGGYGLLSKDGIRKPSLYALRFMNQLGPHLLHKDGNYVVSSDGHDNYYIVCHHTGRLNMEYFYRYEHEADYRHTGDEQSLTVKISLLNVREGTYKVTKHFINQSAGSLLEEWMRLGYPDVLDRDELDYLKGACVPRQSSQRVTSSDSRLALQTILDQNEIQLLKVTYQES